MGDRRPPALTSACSEVDGAKFVVADSVQQPMTFMMVCSRGCEGSKRCVEATASQCLTAPRGLLGNTAATSPVMLAFDIGVVRTTAIGEYQVTFSD
jgi:hypothetical protein